MLPIVFSNSPLTVRVASTSIDDFGTEFTARSAYQAGAEGT